jgi:hypothetical protein
MASPAPESVSLDLLALHSGVDKCSLSLAERLLISLPTQKVKRISETIDDLATKRKLVSKYAESVGWSMTLRF